MRYQIRVFDRNTHEVMMESGASTLREADAIVDSVGDTDKCYIAVFRLDLVWTDKLLKRLKL